MLTLAMILTSASFATAVGAETLQRNAENSVVTESEKTELPAQTTEEGTTEPLTETEALAPAEAEGEAVPEVSVVTQEDGNQIDDGVDAGNEDAIDEEIEEAPEEVPEEAFAEEDKLTASALELMAPFVLIDEGTLTGPTTLALKDEYIPDPGTGTAQKKYTSTTVRLPAGTEEIPAGIFGLIPGDEDNDDYEAAYGVLKHVTTIQFDSCSETLETLEDGAFRESAIRNITLPANVKTIPADCFKDSKGLATVNLSNVTEIKESAFASTSLSSVTMTKVTAIGKNSFKDCSSLTTVNLSAAETIGANAFNGCSKLSSVTWGTTLNKIGASAFSGCGFTTLNLDTITAEIEIGNQAFAENKVLLTAIVPRKLKKISKGMFENCTKMTGVTMLGYSEGSNGNTTTEIVANAFYNCSSLKKIDIGSNVHTIGNNAFDLCTVLNEVNFHYKDWDGDEGDAYPSHITIPTSAFLTKNVSSKAKMRGYDRLVKDYADQKGYVYESLYPYYSITRFSKTSGSVTPSVSKENAGEKVDLVVKPAEGYVLKSGSLKLRESGNPFSDPELISIKNDTQTFRFTMPAGDVVIEAEFVTIDKAITGNLRASFDPVEYYNEENKTLVFDKAGKKTKISVEDDNGAVGLWNFDIKSTNTDSVSITSLGVITAMQKGTSSVSLIAKGNKNKKLIFSAEVQDDTIIDTISFDSFFKTATIPGATLIAPDRITDEYSDDYDEDFAADPTADRKYWIVQYDLATIVRGDESFLSELEAFEALPEGQAAPEDRESVLALSSWASTDRGIASVASKNSKTNSNTVTVVKKSSGETFISARITNRDPEATYAFGGFIVRVLDSTPRLRASNYVINRIKTGGEELQFVEVYNKQIDTDAPLQVVTKKVDKLANVTWTEFNQLKCIPQLDGTYYLAPTAACNVQEGASEIYENKLYIEGYFQGSDISFHVPLEKVEVINEPLKPKLSYEGNINLFYNQKANQTAKILTGLKNEKVDYDKTKLVSEENKAKAGSQTSDAFANNFRILRDAEGSSDTTIVIGRTNETLISKNGQVVTTGYLYLYFKNYTEPVIRKVTIPTTNSAPKLHLDKSTVSISDRCEDPEIEVKVLNQRNEVINFFRTSSDGSEESRIAEINYDMTRTTSGAFYSERSDDQDYEKLQSKVEEGKLVIWVKGNPRNSKAVIRLKLDTWERAQSFVLTVKEASLPKAKYTPNALSLNKKLPNISTTAKLTFNQDTAIFTEYEEMDEAGHILQYAGKAKYKEAAAALIERAEADENGNIKFLLPNDPDSVPAATYSFKVIPRVKFSASGRDFKLASYTIKLTVKDTIPKLSLKSSTFTLNGNFRYNTGEEAHEQIAVVSGLPAGATFELNPADDDITPLMSAMGKSQPIATVGTLAVCNIKVGTKKTLDGNGNVILGTDGKPEMEDDIRHVGLTASLKDTFEVSKKVKYTYTVSGLKIEVQTTDGERDTITVPDFKVSYSIRTTKPTIKVTTSGKLNQVDPNSGIVITPKVNGIKGHISKLSIAEINRKNNDFYYDSSNKKYSHHFEYRQDLDKEELTYLTLHPDRINASSENPYPLENGKKYTLELTYQLEETGDMNYVCKITVTPKQVLPKLNLINTKRNTYAGLSEDERTMTVFVEQKNLAAAAIDVANMNQYESLRDMRGAGGIRMYKPSSIRMRGAIEIVEVNQYLKNADGVYVDYNGKPVWHRYAKGMYATNGDTVCRIDEDGNYLNIEDAKILTMQVDGSYQDEENKPVTFVSSPYLEYYRDKYGNTVYEGKNRVPGFYVTYQVLQPSAVKLNIFNKLSIEVRYDFMVPKTDGRVIKVNTRIFK